MLDISLCATFLLGIIYILLRAFAVIVTAVLMITQRPGESVSGAKNNRSIIIDSVSFRVQAVFYASV